MWGSLCRYLADIYISFLQKHLAAALVDPANERDREVAAGELPSPMLRDNYEYKTICMEEGDLQKGMVQATVWNSAVSLTSFPILRLIHRYIQKGKGYIDMYVCARMSTRTCRASEHGCNF